MLELARNNEEESILTEAKPFQASTLRFKQLNPSLCNVLLFLCINAQLCSGASIQQQSNEAADCNIS